MSEQEQEQEYEFKSAAAEIMHEAICDADMATEGYMGLDRQKAYYAAVGIAFAGLDYSPRMVEGVFKEYRNSLKANDITTPLVNNALDALFGQCNFWWKDGLQDYTSCSEIAIRFLIDPEAYLDNKKARHAQVVRLERFWEEGTNALNSGMSDEEYELAETKIIASTNAEVQAAKLKTADAKGSKSSSNYAAIAGAVPATTPAPESVTPGVI